MSKTRKYLGIVMAIALLLNMAAVAAFAADDSSKTNTWTLVSTAFATEPTVGNSFTVDVQLQAAYYVGPVQFALEYSSADFTATDVVVAAGYPYDALVDFNYANGILRVVIIPDTAGLTSLEAERLDTAATVATITFTYVSGGTIEIVNDYKTDANIDGTLCAFRSTQDDLLNCGPGDLLYGQVPTITAGDHEVGTSYIAPTFQKKAGAAAGIQIVTTKTIGGTFTGTVYGFTQAAANTFVSSTYLNNAFEVLNGTMTFSKYTGFLAAGYGTGTVITIKDTLGATTATYLVVVFGDTDGNGLINATDASAIVSCVKSSTYFSNTTVLGKVKRMTANLAIVTNANLNNLVNANDLSAYLAGTKTGYLNQAAMATCHTTYAYSLYA